MKRSLLLTALAVLFLAVSCSDSGTNQTEKKAPERKVWIGGPLYGDVESVTITRYRLSDKFGEVVKCIDTDYSKEVYKFNSNGDVEEHSRYNAISRALEEKSLCKYDSQGNRIEEAGYNNYGSLSWKHLYKYDSQGNMIELADYDSDGSLSSKYLSKYDSQGHQIEWASYNGDGSLIGKNLIKYDSQGNRIEWARYEGDGSLDWKYLYKYDSQGNWIEEAKYEDDIMKPLSMGERIIVYRK